MKKSAEKVFNEVIRIADRYRVEKTLGIGGMGAVYRVFDESTSKIMALKQLLKEKAKKKPDYVALFQHEYHTLAHLNHPLIIEVFDYGVDEQGPYYTMELLPGRDLKEMAPLPWQEACELLRDVAISLAVLHSRRLVHRDISLRNIRCTQNCRAKLIDFGAMTPMGTLKKAVGTPPFVPPEVVTRQYIDGRSDLYSLGAVAYYLLTNRFAYYSKSISNLIDAWRSRPMPPSTFVPEIPSELDTLVMSLLSLDKLARPVNAAEVIDRLIAIANLNQTELLDLSQAYLITPPLVGRDRLATMFRKMMPNLKVSCGGTIVVESTPGMGRTRLLDAYVLEGKLSGALVTNARAQDARRGDYGVACALVGDLLLQAPPEFIERIKEGIAPLAHILPEIHDRVDLPVLEEVIDPLHLHIQIQEALLYLFTNYSKKRQLMIAVDDLHSCDPPSLAMLAAISRNAPQLKLVVAVTAEVKFNEPLSKTYQMIREVGTVIELEPLTKADLQQLIQSMFGEVPNTQVIVDWVYSRSQGNVRVSMELVRHLVDCEIARYRDGNWILPKNLREQDLPESLEQTLQVRIERLSAFARRLAESLAMVTEHAPLGLEQYRYLDDEEDDKVIFEAIDELVSAQIIMRLGNHYAFSQPGFVEVIKRNLDRAAVKRIHTQLAKAYESGNYDRPMVYIHHLQQSGAAQQALELLVPLMAAGELASEPYPFQVACCESSLKYAEENSGTKRQLLTLRACLVSMARRYDKSLLKYWNELKKQLLADSGMVFWSETNARLDPAERIQSCMQKAWERYNSMNEQQRALNPTEAAGQLIKHAFFVAAVSVPIYDLEISCEMHDILAPFSAVSPAASCFHRELGIGINQVKGYSVHEERLAFLKDFADPVAGLDERVRKVMVYSTSPYYIALDEATNGNPSALERAKLIERDPRFAANAWEVRLVAHIFAGKFQEAEACRRQRELLAIQNPRNDVHLISGLIFEWFAYSISGDLMGLKQVLQSITEKADQYPNWIPVMLSARGNYHLLRGKLTQARCDLEKVLQLLPNRMLFICYRTIPLLVETLLKMGEVEAAYRMAVDSFETFHETFHGICPPTFVTRELSRVLALAEAKSGDFQQAFRRLEETIDKAISENVRGVPLGILYETGSWIALDAKDSNALFEYTDHMAEQYKLGGNPALYSRMQRVLEESQRCRMATASALDAVSTEDNDQSATMTATIATSIPPKILDVLQNCQTLEQKAEQALRLLLLHTEANEGYLYALRKEGLILIAPMNVSKTPGLEQQISEYLKRLAEDQEEETETMTIDIDVALDKQRRVLISDDGYTFQPLVLTAQINREVVIAGVAALRIRTGAALNPTWALVSTIGECIFD